MASVIHCSMWRDVFLSSLSHSSKWSNSVICWDHQIEAKSRRNTNNVKTCSWHMTLINLWDCQVCSGWSCVMSELKWAVGYSRCQRIDWWVESESQSEDLYEAYIQRTFVDQQETVGELLETKVVMDLSLAVLSPSLHCLVTAMGYTPHEELPWHELFFSTDLGLLSLLQLRFLAHLEFAFKGRVLKVGPVPLEDSLFWKTPPPSPFPGQKIPETS